MMELYKVLILRIFGMRMNILVHWGFIFHMVPHQLNFEYERSEINETLNG